MKKIPDELLYEIFLQVAETHFLTSRVDSDDKEYGTGNTIPPWNIAVVSRWWRRVCLDNPRLWSYITFSWHKDSNPYNGSALLRTYTQLERSRSSPLYINAEFRCYCTCECLFSALRIVALQCHRWKTLRFNSSEVEPRIFRTRYLQNRACPQLEFIDWNCWEDNISESTQLPFPNPGELVSLRSACFRFLEHTCPGFPWGQLTSLHLLFPSIFLPDLLSVLSECVHLVHLQIQNGSVYQDSEEEDLDSRFKPGGLVLQHLSSLALCQDRIFFNAPDINQPYLAFLPYICTPSLTSIKYGHLDPTSDVALLNLIERSGCTVKSLRITSTGPTFPWRDRRLLSSLPQLESLTIVEDKPVNANEDDGSPMNRDNLLYMLLPMPGQIAFPSLQHFALDCHFMFDPALLIQVVESRREPGMCTWLKSVEVALGIRILGEKSAEFYNTVLTERLGSIAGFDFRLRRIAALEEEPWLNPPSPF